MRIDIYENGAWTPIADAVLPLKWQYKRDEGFDVGEFMIANSDRSRAIPPYTKIRTVHNSGSNEQKIRYWYGSSQVERTIFENNQARYNHSVVLVEPTQILTTIPTSGSLFSYNTTTNPTMADYFTRLLAITPLQQSGETPIFSIAQSDLLRLGEYEAREFTNQRNTLFEELVEGAKYVHAFPRITGDNGNYSVITFDWFSDIEVGVQNATYFYESGGYNSNDYCTEIETSVQNAICDTMENFGSITTAWMTLRGSNPIITEDDAVVKLPFPIYKLQKVEVCGFDIARDYGGTPLDRVVITEENPYEITSKVVEETEYNTFLSKVSQTEKIKADYITYKIYGDTIYNLFELPEKLFLQISRAAIINVINSLVVENGYTADACVYYENTANLIQWQNLKFRVTYIPVTDSLRAKQMKPLASGQQVTLPHNQSASLVDVIAMGENAKGAVARFGNESKEVSNIYSANDTLPDVNKIVYDSFGNPYFTAVQTVEEYEDTVKVTTEYSKNFNRLSDFIGINQERREFELSVDNVAQRNLLHEEICWVGDADAGQQNETRFTQTAILRFCLGGGAPQIAYSQVVFSNTEASPIYLPLKVFPYGNSVIFNFAFENNISAESQSLEIDESKREDSPCKYVDENGEFETLGIQLCTLADAQYNANLYPLGDPPTGSAIFDNLLTPWRVLKDRREKIAGAVQLHFLPNRTDYFVGSGLARTNGLVLDNMPQLQVYALKEPVGQLNSGKIPVGAELWTNGRVEFSTYSTHCGATVFGDSFSFSNGDAPNGWAVCDTNGNLLFGRNVTGRTIAGQHCYFNFKTKKYSI